MKKQFLSVLALGLVVTIMSCKSTSDSGTVDTQGPENMERREGRPEGGGEQGQRPERKSASQLIAEMDANTDGKLSASEVKGPLKDHFSRIDADGDGFLTETEIENGKPQGKGGDRPRR